VNEPNWIGKTACLAVHGELLARFGGLAGVRDEGLLDSALARPQHRFAYGTQNFFELAAVYAEGIAKNHPFLDGNKRTALVTAALFLEANGFLFHPPEEEAVLQTLALAAGETDAEAYAAWLSRSCTRRGG